jgi:chromosomal replication initiator protein
VSNKGAHGSILFVYGPSPSGKTQLLKTTAKQYLDEYGERPCEVTFNQLINDLVAEIKNEETSNFFEKYSSAKLLLIDDVQHMLEFPAIQKILAETLADIAERGVNVIFFSGYKLSDLADLFGVLQDKKICVLKSRLYKADMILRRKLLENILSRHNTNLTKREFRYIVTNRKIEISAFNGCISKLVLTKLLETDKNKFIDTIGLLKEYER